MTARNLLISLLLFLGIGALAGGTLLILSPSGKWLGNLPISILDRSPFSNFLVPGMILFSVIGLAPCLTSIALLKKTSSPLADRFNLFSDMHWSWSFSIYIAFALMIWIQVETFIVQSVGWLQTFYMLYSIPILLVALLPSIRTL
jgi:hypothetical protein